MKKTVRPNKHGKQTNSNCGGTENLAGLPPLNSNY